MDKAAFNQKVLPHIVAVAVFLIVTIIFFHPIVFENKTLDQHDILQGAGANQEILEYWDETGEQALWTNSMFSGMPSYLIHVRWNDEVLWFIQKVASFSLPAAARETILPMICFYILLLTFGVRPYLAIGGAIAFGLNTYLMVSIEAGHMWKVRAIAFMPLVLAGIHLTFRKKYFLGGALTALAMALEILANHLQITYYLFILVVIYGVVQLVYHIKEKRAIDFLKVVGVLLLAVSIGLASNLGRLWATYEYGQYSTRGPSELVMEDKGSDAKAGLDREYVFNWSSGVWESFTLLVPHLYGGASGNYTGKNSELSDVLRRNNLSKGQINQYEQGLLGYWGDQPFTAGPTYAGAALCLIFVIGIFFVEKKHRIWLLIAFFLSIVLSWGKNFPSFNYLIYDILPGYNKFRSVTFTVFIALLCMNLLGFVGLENLIKNGLNKENQKKLFIGGGIVAGLLILIALFASPPALESGNIPKAIRDAVEEDRLSIIRGDVMRSLFYVVLIFAVIYFYLKQKINFAVFAILLVIFVTLDLYLIDTRYINKDNFVKKSSIDFFQPTEADKAILKDETKYRVLNLANPWNEARTSYYHSSIGGYHGAKMKRYAELIEYQLSNDVQEAIKRLRAGNADFSGLEALNMLNAKYLKAGDTRSAVFLNKQAYGNAWLVENIIPVESANEEIEIIGDTDLRSNAVINKEKFDIKYEQVSDSGSVNLVEYNPNYLKYEVNAFGNAFTVFSEIYYPKGWNAYIDGNEVDIIQTNYVLRGLFVPEGQHTIEFRFEPKPYLVGNKIGGIASYLLVVLFLGSIVFSFVRAKD